MSTPDFDPKKIPHASFSFLVSTLGAQAAVALGMAPNPMTNKTEVQPELGKHEAPHSHQLRRGLMGGAGAIKTGA